MQLTHMKCRMYTRVGHGKGVEHKCSVGRVQAVKVTQQSMADTVDSLWRTGGHIPEKQQVLSFPWQFSSPNVG